MRSERSEKPRLDFQTVAPATDDRYESQSVVPQKENQSAIYHQLDKWIAKGEVDTVFSEGCTGEIDDKFPKAYNGWTLKDLTAKAGDKNYDDIVTLVPLKLEAKYGAKLKTLCADDEALIKEHNLAFSDARGTIGFLTRLTEFRFVPEKLKPYFEKVKSVYKLPPDTSIDNGIKALKEDLKKTIVQIDDVFAKRDKNFVEAIKKNADKSSAFVVGGAHTAAIVDLLKKEKIDCTVVQPTGYSLDEEKLRDNFHAFLKR
jgi:hypothetical protein